MFHRKTERKKHFFNSVVNKITTELLYWLERNLCLLSQLSIISKEYCFLQICLKYFHLDFHVEKQDITFVSLPILKSYLSIWVNKIALYLLVKKLQSLIILYKLEFVGWRIQPVGISNVLQILNIVKLIRYFCLLLMSF